MRIIVLGARGMLGQMAVRYFRARGVDLVVVNERFDFSAQCPGLSRLASLGPGLVLNCIGLIGQKSLVRQDLCDANALLPLQIYERLCEGQFLVHPSTDCVFSGRRSAPYSTADLCDATEDYGWSKRLGEVALAGKPQAVVLRVSLIGPDALGNPPQGLLGWFLGQPDGSKLDGYANHFWNGVTTLEWCRKVDEFFAEGLTEGWGGRIVQLGTNEVYSKYDMLLLFQELYRTRHTISPVSKGAGVYRVLRAEYVSPPLRNQLKDLVAFWGQ